MLGWRLANILNNVPQDIAPCFGVRLVPQTLLPSPGMVSGGPPVGTLLTAICADGTVCADGVPCHEAIEVYSHGAHPSPIVKIKMAMDWGGAFGFFPVNFAMRLEWENSPNVPIARGIHTPDTNGFPFLGSVVMAPGIPPPAFSAYGVIVAMQLATVAGAGPQFVIAPNNRYHATIQNLGADAILVYPSPALANPTDANSFRIASNQTWDDEIGNGWGLSLAVIPGGVTPQVTPADTRVRLYS